MKAENTINLILAIILMVAVTVFILTRKAEKFKNKIFNTTWGKLYDGVDEKKGNGSHLIMLFFMVRRFLLVTLIDENFHT